ncbi:hypothetical protein MCGE09_00444 [Thaumarchaeota archaeon SCGC AB-539-E09]|nr:hypothetical protein MCGE09_00444 [Thaumarchaeota archaeon SCGC AB-539-E09]
MLNKDSSRAKELIKEINQIANRIDMIDPKITENDLRLLRKVATVKIEKFAYERDYHKTDLSLVIQQLKNSVIEGKYDDQLHLNAGEIFANYVNDVSLARARSRKAGTNTRQF